MFFNLIYRYIQADSSSMFIPFFFNIAIIKNPIFGILSILQNYNVKCLIFFTIYFKDSLVENSVFQTSILF